MNQLQQDENFQLKKTLTDNFPFKPYDIQVNFAFSLYQALQQHKKLSILESPTGTGKTLSIISGSFQWLLENQFNYKKIQEKVMKEENQKEDKDQDLEGIPDWMMNAEDFQERNYKICVQKFQDQIVLKKQKFQLFMQNLQANLQKKGWNKQMIIDQKKREQEKNGNNDDSLQEKEEQILKQYEIDLIQNKQGKNLLDKRDNKNNIKSEFGIQNKNRNLHLNQFQQIEQQEDIFNELERFQIIYASKTHSQISQFVNEIKKTKFGQKFRVITLSSRNQLCVDKQIQKQKLQGTQLTEACKIKQENKECKFYSNYNKFKQDLDYLFFEGKQFLKEKQDFYQKSQQNFSNKNENESKIHDIEEMKQSAENCEICPYYLSKQAVKYADIICLPYVSLIDEKTRAGFGLNLKNKILIMDEAHNLLDASNQILSNELSFRQVSQVIQELQFYLNKYKSRLKSQNQMYIKQLLSLGQNIFNFMKTQFEQNKKEQSQNQGYKKISNLKFLSEIKIDNFDVFQLQKFIQESRLSHKIHFFYLNYIRKQKQNQTKNENNECKKKSQEDEGKHQTENFGLQQELSQLQEPQVLQKFIDFFFQCLISENQNNTILLKQGVNQKKQPVLHQFSIKIMNLNCFKHLTEVIDEAYSLVLTGGTMEPIQEFELLIDMIGRQNYSKFQCGHVIPKENLKVFIVKEKKNQTVHEKCGINRNIKNENEIIKDQNNTQDIKDIKDIKGIKDINNKNTTQNTCQKLELIYNYENKENEQKKKLLFQESAQIIYEIQKQIPNGVIVFLQSYKDVLEMKEFVEKIYVRNRDFEVYLFFDGFGSGEQLLLEYGECIKKGKEAVLVSVMGGKLSEGINFKDEMARGILVFGLPFPNRNAPELREKMQFYDQQQNPEFKGKDYYFNGCLKVVNQTIGRCIRHINDYSLVFLIDKRFGDQQIIQGLPQWVKPAIQPQNLEFQEVLQQSKLFFESKKQE